jgi:hypothetical protein
MHLINKNLDLLTQYQNLLGIHQNNWPFTVLNDNIQYNSGTINENIENYWNQYRIIFNNHLQNGNLNANPTFTICAPGTASPFIVTAKAYMLKIKKRC